MGEELELNEILKLLNLNENSTKGLQIATSRGMIDPTKWLGKLISPSGDITHLTDRELSKLDEFLKNGKYVETDEIKELKQKGRSLSNQYSSKIIQNNAWVLKLNLQETASPRLRKELDSCFIISIQICFIFFKTLLVLFTPTGILLI